MSGTARSGVATAGGVAPLPAPVVAPIDPDRGQAQAPWPARGRGRGSGRRAGSARAARSTRSKATSKLRWLGLVAADLLGGDDPVERDSQPTVRRGEQVVVAVGDHPQPEPPPEPRQGAARVREGRPLAHRAAERRRLSAVGSTPSSAQTPRRPRRARRGSAGTGRTRSRPRGGRSAPGGPRRRGDAVRVEHPVQSRSRIPASQSMSVP